MDRIQLVENAQEPCDVLGTPTMDNVDVHLVTGACFGNDVTGT